MVSASVPKLFPWRIFYRVALVQSVLILLALASSGLVARQLLKRQFVLQIQSRLHDALLIALEEVPNNPSAQWCQRFSEHSVLQLTLMRADGTVLCDTLTDPAKLGNLSDRQEFRRASALSDVVYERETDVLYGAVRKSAQGPVLRAAIPLTELVQTLRVFDTSFGIALAVVAAILGGLAIWLARRLVFPLGRLILKTQRLVSQQPEVLSKDDLTQEVFDEWADLESNIDRLKRDLAAKTQSLSMEQLELDTIMGAISDAILAVDPQGSPLFYNSRFEVLFGSEGLRRRNLKLWGIFREPDILGTFEAALKEGRAGATKAISLEQKLGPRRFFALSVSPLRKQDGVIYGALGIFHDVTELKSAEQMRIDFVANVSHELRTPLTVIKGYADTLILDFKDKQSDALDFLNSIARNSDRLMNLMNDLLDLSSLESDSIIQKDPLSTQDVTERILKQLQGAFDSKSQKVETFYDTKTVVADAQRLEQVLVNLLSNANKYTPAGGTVRIRWKADGADTVLVMEDTGPGIPVEHHSRLFERFYRVDKARSREQGGTGLGLAIVKHIMQRHEGAVWVESQTGQGSAFFCRFPGQQTQNS
jgi:two-component system, OmpR family, phosphate regulon sensor histidine kinase PhoR